MTVRHGGYKLKTMLLIQQSNPKKQGSKSYFRYEAYKEAKTVDEYFQLGGSKADLAFDFERGYVKVAAEAGLQAHEAGEGFEDAAADLIEDLDCAEKVADVEPADTVVWNDGPYWRDMCDACGLPTVTKSGEAIPNTLICETCDCEVHLRCAGLKRVPIEAWSCSECEAAKQRDDQRWARAAPKEVARQLGSRCVMCGRPGSTDRRLGGELFFCDTADCWGVYHMPCVLQRIKSIGAELALSKDDFYSITIDQLKQATKCPRCRSRSTDAKTAHWRLVIKDKVDIFERARVHAIAMGRASAISSDLARTCLHHALLPFVPPTDVTAHTPPLETSDNKDQPLEKHGMIDDDPLRPREEGRRDQEARRLQDEDVIVTEDEPQPHKESRESSRTFNVHPNAPKFCDEAGQVEDGSRLPTKNDMPIETKNVMAMVDDEMHSKQVINDPVLMVDDEQNAPADATNPVVIVEDRPRVAEKTVDIAAVIEDKFQAARATKNADAMIANEPQVHQSANEATAVRADETQQHQETSHSDNIMDDENITALEKPRCSRPRGDQYAASWITNEQQPPRLHIGPDNDARTQDAMIGANDFLKTNRDKGVECYQVGGGWWIKRDSSSGKMFYVNQLDGRTQWVRRSSTSNRNTHVLRCRRSRTLSTTISNDSASALPATGDVDK